MENCGVFQFGELKYGSKRRSRLASPSGAPEGRALAEVAAQRTERVAGRRAPGQYRRMRRREVTPPYGRHGVFAQIEVRCIPSARCGTLPCIRADNIRPYDKSFTSNEVPPDLHPSTSSPKGTRRLRRRRRHGFAVPPSPHRGRRFIVFFNSKN